MAKVEVPQAERLTLLQAAALPGEFLELGVASGHSGARELPRLWDCSKCFLISVHHRMGSAAQLEADLALALAEIAPVCLSFGG